MSWSTSEQQSSSCDWKSHSTIFHFRSQPLSLFCLATCFQHVTSHLVVSLISCLVTLRGFKFGCLYFAFSVSTHTRDLLWQVWNAQNDSLLEAHREAAFLNWLKQDGPHNGLTPTYSSHPSVAGNHAGSLQFINTPGSAWSWGPTHLFLWLWI